MSMHLAGIFGEVNGLLYCCIAAPNYSQLFVPEGIACTYNSAQHSAVNTLW